MLRTIVLGSGGAWPDGKRNPPAFAIVVNNEILLFDMGGGTASSLMKVDIKPAEIKYYFLSHIHIDHCNDFPSLVLGSYLTGKKDEINLFGPSGVKRWCNALFNDVYNFAYPMVKSLRNVDVNINITEVGSGLVFETQNWKITSAKVKHGIETLAFRLDSDEGSITYSGDTSPCRELIELAEGSDILIQDCSFPDSAGERPGHCIPKQVGEIAKQANIHKVVLFHMFPSCEGHESEIINSVKAQYSGEVILSEDLMSIKV